MKDEQYYQRCVSHAGVNGVVIIMIIGLEMYVVRQLSSEVAMNTEVYTVIRSVSVHAISIILRNKVSNVFSLLIVSISFQK